MEFLTLIFNATAIVVGLFILCAFVVAIENYIEKRIEAYMRERTWKNH